MIENIFKKEFLHINMTLNFNRLRQKIRRYFKSMDGQSQKIKSVNDDTISEKIT